MKVKLIDIFLLFAKIGCMIFGGGVVILPLLEAEAVKKRGWVTSEELVEYYAISQVIPGINIPDVSMFVGYKLRGKSGAVIAGLGIILVPFLLIVSFSALINLISQNSFVKSAFWGVEIGSIIIIINAVRTIWNSSIVDKFSFIFFIIVFSATAFTKLSPVWIVFATLFLGILKGVLTKESGEAE